MDPDACFVVNNDDDDEYDFSDDALDGLPAHALQQLETTAIRATQQHYHPRALESNYGLGPGGYEVNYGEVQDEVVNLNDIAVPTPAPWTTLNAPGLSYSEISTAAGHGGGNTGEGGDVARDSAMADELPRRSQADPDQLLLRIKKLEQEKARLAREIQSEKSKLLLKSGETETARRRLDAATREHERRLSTLQQSHNEAIATLRAELERMRREREQARTNTMFLEHDLALEADKAKRPRRYGRDVMPVRPRQPVVPSPYATPKRPQRNLPLRDGFDDEDMVTISPTRNREKSKPSTPKQATKRKRPNVDQSPVPALQLTEPQEKIEEIPPGPWESDRALLDSLSQSDRRYELLRLLLNRRASGGRDIRILEALSQHTLPSQVEIPLSSRLLDGLSSCSADQNPRDVALRMCHLLLSMWDQCLQERYYAPIYLLTDAIHLILASEPCSTAIALAERVVPTILASVDLVAFPIARAGMKCISTTDMYSPFQRKVSEEIDVIGCLDLLQVVAASCKTSAAAAAQLWQCIPIDFPLHLLRKAQALPCITRMVLILSTSNLPDSIGPRVLNAFGPEQQEKREADLIDRLTKLLADELESIPDPSIPDLLPRQAVKFSLRETLELRLQILDLLTAFSTSVYGCSRLASLRYCIGRLVKFLDEQIAKLYLGMPFPTHELVVASINTTMRLIYHLRASTPGLDIKTKVNVIPGGHHRYLVALTRLAFSERLVLEHGIEKDVVDAAYAILDAGLTPEEGEGLLQVFSSGSTS